MPPIILHQYDLSPFCEKVRLAFGLKGMEWHAVETPIWPPKPDLVPLTGGYRRAPVLQLGADIFCDSNLILRELERRQPTPSLFPDGQEGLALAVGWWAEKLLFFPAATLVTSFIGDQLPPEFVADRKAAMGRDFGQAASLAEQPLNRQRLHAHLAWLAQMLADGRPFLLGATASAADLAAYHPLWFARQNGGPEVEALLPLAPLLDWMARVVALGHGQRRTMRAEDALDIAQALQPRTADLPLAEGDPCGLRPGTPVTVRADDYAQEPVAGTLVAADAQEIVIRHENDRVGAIHVHFPRAGYDVVAA